MSTQIPPLALSNIIDISVTVSPSTPAVNPFNIGLFVGPSTVIPSYGANSRVQTFTSPATVLAAGFSLSSPEYLASLIYFDQTPTAAKFALGRQDLTALQTVTVAGRTVTDGVMTLHDTTLDSATADFVTGDVGSIVIVEGAGTAGAALVTTISTITSTTACVLATESLTAVTGAQTSIGFTGSGYHANDLVTVTQAGGNYGTVKVLTVGISGQVLTAAVVSGQQGTGYTVASSLPTVAVSPATGTGLEVNITAVGETLLEAVTACRAASGLWYGLAVNAPTLTDNLYIAEWADPQWQSTRYYAYSGDAAIPAGTPSNLALQLQTLNLRVIGQYATTQSGLYPNNVYAAVAAMGVEMGLQTGLANSFFTLAHKTLAGIAPEPLTQTQYQNIVSSGFNVYGNFQAYQLEEPGFMSNGAPSYLWLYLAILVAELQNTEMAVLQGNPAVAQTNAAQQLLIQAANEACGVLSAIGFLATAAWEGAPVSIPGVSMQVGQAVPSGYQNQSQPYSQQSLANRDAGQAMPIYSFVTTAGVVQSLMIAVYVEL